MVKGSASNIAATDELAFFARIADICSQSESLPWQTVLQQTLAAFAEVAKARRVAILLLDDLSTPLVCVPLSPDSESLCAALTADGVRWQDFNPAPGLSKFTLCATKGPPVYILPIPPTAVGCRAFFALSGRVAQSVRPLLEKGLALLTPLIATTRQRLLEQRSSSLQTASAPAPEINQEQLLDQILELKRRQTYLESLNRVVIAINGMAVSESLDDVLSEGIKQAVQISGMTRGAVYLVKKDELELRTQCGFTPEDPSPAPVLHITEGSGAGIRFKQKMPDDVDATGQEAPVNMPLIIDKTKIVGMMSLIGPAHISLEMQHLLSSIAEQLALAIQRERVIEQMREQMRYFSEINRAFLSLTAFGGIVFILLRALSGVVEDALATAFYRRTDDGQWSRDQVYKTLATPDPVRQRWIKEPAWEVEISSLNACYQEQMLVLASRRRARIPTAWNEIELLGIQQIIYFPLFFNEDFFGVAAVTLPNDRQIPTREFQRVWVLIGVVSAALMRDRLSSEWRSTENRLRAILKSSRDGIFLLGNDLTVHYINRSAISLLMLPGDEESWEKHHLSEVEALVQSEAPRFAAWLAQVIQDIDRLGLEELEEEVLFETAHGLSIRLQHKAVAMHGHETRPSLLLLLQDITEQRALAQMRDDLLSMLVHDMRSPLSVIQNAIQLLQDPAMRDVGDEVLNIAMSNTGKLLELVNTILEISRLESGRFDLTQEAIYLPDLVYETSKEYTLAMNSVDFRVSIPAELPLLWVDPAVIGRVLMNLLSNALKFVPPENGIIYISATLKKDWVTIEVYNNGPHIPTNVYKRLFQKFVAGDYEKRGYGLGLSFCKLAVEAHGGEIQARNQHNGGVSLIFTLPVFRVPDFPDEEKSTSQEVAQTSSRGAD